MRHRGFKASSARCFFAVTAAVTLVSCNESANPLIVEHFSAIRVTYRPGMGNIVWRIYKSGDKYRRERPTERLVPTGGVRKYQLSLSSGSYEVTEGDRSSCRKTAPAGSGPGDASGADRAEVTRTEIGAEIVDGHPTRIAEVRYPGDGRSSMKVWLATDLRDFPLRIEFENGVTQSFKDVSLDDPPASLFEKPASCIEIETPKGESPEVVDGMMHGYRPLDVPQPTASGKIEVVEFFSYGFSSAALYPVLTRWAARLPADVVFRRVAVETTGEVYYALEAAGELNKLEAALFRAIKDEGQQVTSETTLIDWVAAHGGNAEKFRTAYHSAGVRSKLDLANAIFHGYHIKGALLDTPSIVVDGRYRAWGITDAELIEHAEALIDKVRAQRQVAAQGSPN